jgi:hypothetical protein
MLLLLSMQQSHVRPNDKKTTTVQKSDELCRPPWASSCAEINERRLLTQKKPSGFGVGFLCVVGALE